MDEFTLRWAFPFTPGAFEIIIFGVIVGSILVSVKLGFLQADITANQKLLLLLSILAVASICRTLVLSAFYASVPWGLTAGYFIAIVALAILALMGGKLALPLVTIACFPVVLLCLRPFFNSHVEVQTVGMLNPTSLDFFREARRQKEFEESGQNQDIYKGDIKTRLNGNRLEIVLEGASQPTIFTNQGFAPLQEEANLNHVEVLEKLVEKRDPAVQLTVALTYRFWALSSINLVAIEGVRFKNFYYMPWPRFSGKWPSLNISIYENSFEK